MMCDFKQTTQHVGLKIHPDKTKILSNRSTNRRKEVKILFAWESSKYPGQKMRSSIRKQQRSKIESEPLGHRSPDTRADIKIVPLAAQTPPIQHGDHADAELRFWHSWTPSEEHERLIRSTQPKMLLLIVQMKETTKRNTEQQERERWRRR